MLEPFEHQLVWVALHDAIWSRSGSLGRRTNLNRNFEIVRQQRRGLRELDDDLAIAGNANRFDI